MAADKKLIGVALVNLGTPLAPTPREVGRYLREFLMDPLVVDIPYLLRWLLVNVIIVPRRKHQSAALYQKIWGESGSPLLTHTEQLCRQVQDELGSEYLVRTAMRYGEPSFSRVVGDFKRAGVSQVVMCPLYPQYSLAATASSVDAWQSEMARQIPSVETSFVPAFYNSPHYLDAVAQISRPHLGDVDKVLFSFHGLPERQVKKTGMNHCLEQSDCCSTVCAANRDCYRAQSFATANGVAQRLGLAEGQWEVGFQSRLGRTPWIRPYSDELYAQLPARGCRKLAVLTPSFVADCLETLEEVQMRGEETFRSAGGDRLHLVPSLNSHPIWVRAVSNLVREAL